MRCNFLLQSEIISRTKIGNCRTRRPPISFFFLCGRRGVYYLSDVFCSFFFFFSPPNIYYSTACSCWKPTFRSRCVTNLSAPNGRRSPFITWSHFFPLLAWPQPCLPLPPPPPPSTLLSPTPQLFPFVVSHTWLSCLSRCAVLLKACSVKRQVQAIMMGLCGGFQTVRW